MKRKNLLFSVAFFTIGMLIVSLILFAPPSVGVADQGDFGRVLFGITYPPTWSDEYFFRYTSNVYQFTAFPESSLWGMPPAVSQIYFIYAGRVLSQMFELPYFDMSLYALVVGFAYVLGLTLLYGALLPRHPLEKILLGAGLYCFFLDGRWVQWFNSLYGEPVVMIGFLLTAGLALLTDQLRTRKIAAVLLFPLAAAELIMVGGKLQAIVLFVTALFINGFLAYRLWQTRGRRVHAAALCVFSAVLLFYCFGIYTSVGEELTNKDTIYQSVFTGILANSRAPERTLHELGLDPAFMSDIGHNAYLPETAYVFGPIDGDLMQEKFFDHVSNTTIIRYYLTHPGDFFKGLRYLGTQSLTISNHGIHAPEYGYVTEHHRFTLWNGFRSRLPHRFWFLGLVLLAALAVSAELYKRGKKPYAMLIRALALGGCLQFPIPYLFNGMCDTAKQLMVFNFIFDLLIFAVTAFLVNEIFRIELETGGLS